MKWFAWAVLSAVTIATAPATAQQTTPFKLGTFDDQGRPFVGVVLREEVVIDLAAASAEVQPATAVPMPTDMKDLIERYDTGVRERIGQILRSVGDLSTAPRPAWAYEVADLRILPPIMYPITMLNVAVNYAEHDIEMVDILGTSGQAGPTGGAALPGTESAPGIWERDDDDWRWNPYMFLKAPATVIADGEPIRFPPNRTQIEWECELSIVVGRTAGHVPVERAEDYIFGYTLQNDVSDRGGRGDVRYGSDWLVAKSHDTFGPTGPFITPKEFLPDVQRTQLRFILNGEVLQEGSTGQMIHTFPELLAYGSSIITLRPGDLIATGTAPGAGSARTPPIFLRPGDVSVCTYDGVGTLTNPVVGWGQ